MGGIILKLLLGEIIGSVVVAWTQLAEGRDQWQSSKYDYKLLD
jgi:hypothetical protein